jgi:predicted phosphoribosyltransferase
VSDFVDIDDAAKQVGALVRDLRVDVIFAVLPNGVPIAAEIAGRLDVEVRSILFNRETNEMALDTVGLESESIIWVVDDGVESGKAATAVGQLLKNKGFTAVELVVPICARDAQAQLQFFYQAIHAVAQPLMTRALKWHYELVPDVSEADANQILQQLKGRRH